MKICTIKIQCGDNVNQNAFKSWLRTIPPELSKPGDQTITWENRPDKPAKGTKNGKKGKK